MKFTFIHSIILFITVVSTLLLYNESSCTNKNFCFKTNKEILDGINSYVKIDTSLENIDYFNEISKINPDAIYKESINARSTYLCKSKLQDLKSTLIDSINDFKNIDTNNTKDRFEAQLNFYENFVTRQLAVNTDYQNCNDLNSFKIFTKFEKHLRDQINKIAKDIGLSLNKYNSRNIYNLVCNENPSYSDSDTAGFSILIISYLLLVLSSLYILLSDTDIDYQAILIFNTITSLIGIISSSVFYSLCKQTECKKCIPEKLFDETANIASSVTLGIFLVFNIISILYVGMDD